MPNKTVTIPEPTEANITSIRIKMKNGTTQHVFAELDMGPNHPGSLMVDIGAIPQNVLDAFDTFLGHLVTEFKSKNGF